MMALMKSYPGLFLPDNTCETLARTTLIVSANWDWEIFSAAINCFRRVFISVTVDVTNVRIIYLNRKDDCDVVLLTG